MCFDFLNNFGLKHFSFSELNEVKGWGESVNTICVGKNTRHYIQYFLTMVLFTFCTCGILSCLVCIVVSRLVCIVVSCLVCIVVSCLVCVFLWLSCVNCC